MRALVWKLAARSESDQLEELEGVGGGSDAWAHDVIELHFLDPSLRFKVLAEVDDLSDVGQRGDIGEFQIVGAGQDEGLQLHELLEDRLDSDLAFSRVGPLQDLIE